MANVLSWPESTQELVEMIYLETDKISKALAYCEVEVAEERWVVFDFALPHLKNSASNVIGVSREINGRYEPSSQGGRTPTWVNVINEVLLLSEKLMTELRKIDGHMRANWLLDAKRHLLRAIKVCSLIIERMDDVTLDGNFSPEAQRQQDARRAFRKRL